MYRTVGVFTAAYDEVDNIRPLSERLLASLRGQPGLAFELIFVVEGTDGTAAALRGLAATASEIRMIEPPQARGLGAAFRLGFAAVSGNEFLNICAETLTAAPAPSLSDPPLPTDLWSVNRNQNHWNSCCTGCALAVSHCQT